MDIVRLRTLWEEHVSTTDKEVLDKVWQILCERYGDLVVFACTNPKAGLEDLLEYTEPVIEGWRLGRGHAKPRGRVAQQIVDVDLDDYERQCAETASLYLAKKAASRPEVRRFRQERLGGKLLTTEEAKEFLRGELLREESDDLHSPNELPWTWSDIVGDMRLVELLEFVVPIEQSAVGSSQRMLFPYEGAIGRMYSEMEIAKNYSELCLYLAGIFPWHPYDTALFLLTGKRPEVVPLELFYNRYRRVFTLNFAPWISEKTIRKAYRKCQRVVQGGDNRRMQERTLAVMRFVTEHTDDEGKRSTWSQLTDLWNEHYPGEWRFKDRFGMRKTYLRAEKELARPWR
jgi:hypothetical protein